MMSAAQFSPINPPSHQNLTSFRLFSVGKTS
jgi:hypothetical protein